MSHDSETIQFQDQLREPVSKCPTGVRAFNANADVVKMGCDQWKCPECRKVLSWRCARRARYGIALWPSEAFMWTLTLPGYVDTPQRAFRLLPARWDSLRKRIQRFYGEFQYAAFVELHPRREGIAHFHIVSLCPCPGRIKDVAAHAGFGYQATETVIDGAEAANYVAKYTSKQGSNMPRGFRRVRFSHDWPKLPDPTYDVEIYPLRRGERLSAYLHRCSALTGLPAHALFVIWQHPEIDL